MPPDELKEIIAVVRARERLRAIVETLTTVSGMMTRLAVDPVLQPEVDAAAEDMLAATEHLGSVAEVLNARMDNLA